MSVASRNLFTLLGEDEADSTPAPVAAPKTPAPPPKKEQPQKGPSTRGGRYYPRGGGRNVARDEETVENKPDDGGGERGRGRGRGRGGRGRGDGGGRGRGRDPRPDRHSQMDRTDTDKRVSSGWGANEGKTELDAEQSGAADAAKAADEWGAPAADDWGAPPPEDSKQGQDQPEQRQNEEEEDNTMTLSEYLAKKKAAENLPSKPEGRTIEGSDTSLWKDAIQLQHNEDDENYFVGKTKATPKARTKKEEKVHIEIEARFAPIERGRGRGDRGGRGGDRRGSRGGVGRGADAGTGRSRRNDNPNLDVADETAFPSLS